jgi:hypothetical protein
MTDVSVAHLHQVDAWIHSYIANEELVDRQRYNNYQKRTKITDNQLLSYSSLIPFVYRPSESANSS